MSSLSRRGILKGGAGLAAGTVLAPAGQPVRAHGFGAPHDFLWGASTAAHQVEGNNINSDYWLLENLPGSPFVEKSGDTCDHYHRYPADIAMMREAGLNAYRLSIEWARIEPEPGQYSTAALGHYRSVLATCRKNGIVPVVTFHHFTSPSWLAASGGWEVQKTADRFAKYCEVATQHLGDLIGVACTINELNFTSLLDAKEFIPVERRKLVMRNAAQSIGVDSYSCPPFGNPDATARTVIAAHRQAMEAIKSGPGDFPVGLTLSMSEFEALEGGEAKLQDIRYRAEDQFLEAAKGDDFIGVQAYTREQIGPSGFAGPAEGAEQTQMGYEVRPEATEHCIRRAHAITGNRVIVTESGIATDDDAQRITFIDETLAGIKRTMADGIPVDGYFHWSLLDNFEWTNGYAPKFGLIGVDRRTFKRTPKPSLAHLGALIQNGDLV